ncbi:CBS domain-containing protein [Bradyrhizobium japonicum]|uniref:CBS domain-containing protein n=1 Tax=Bradyrhizobium japonicum TaxID=375 RepID=UPI0020113311|nr:CBS domain-containing protein [Bradyrhizobium japonicum]
MKAADIMRTWFATIGPSAPLLDALHLLLETNQRGLPVVDDGGALVGIISESDFLHIRELGVEYLRDFGSNGCSGRTRANSLAGEPVAFALTPS